MEKSEKILKKIIRFSAFISGLCILLMMLMTMWDIIGRRFFSSSVPGVYELSSLGLVVISFLAMGYPQIEGENVGVTMVYDRMKPKVKAVMDFLVSIVCIALFAVVVKQTITFALRMSDSNQITPVLHIPLQPFVYITAIGIVVLILGFILDLLKSIRDFKGDRLDV
ncbi:MAG TPA: TRAP transporter small permease [Anaerovoracaceae bacterium]|nr:TRAP transporter small permease [Anaerovoracaceae bacterium]